MEETKDFVGNTLRVGDKVVYQPSVYKGLRRGFISAISKSGLSVDIGDVECYRPVRYVVKVVPE